MTRIPGRRTRLMSRLVVSVVALATPVALAGQARPSAPSPPGPLAFHGFSPGMSLSAVRREIRAAGGPVLICRRSRADTLVVDCRGTLPARDGAPALEIWLSAIGGETGVLSLAGQFDSAGLGYWRASLSSRYGDVRTARQGTQRMMQWVRRGTMLRLTWRAEGSRPLLSLSYVDGHVLDAWARSRRGEDIAKDSVTR